MPTGEDPMPLKKLTELLDQNKVHYAVIKHSPAYTASQIAESAHVPGREMAKAVVVKIDGRLAMAVLPATDVVHAERLRKSVGAKEVAIAGEQDFDKRFPDCELGAMPPFGNLFDMETFVSPHLTQDEQICFNAGTHDELIRMPYGEFERLAKPVEIEF
jgi:Ala-tRNA(Pro) deacylase